MVSKKIIVFASIVLLFLMSQSGVAALTAKTPLTVVNITSWGGYGSPSQVIDYGVGVGMSDISYAVGHISWRVNRPCAWKPFSNGLAQRIWKISTKDLGVTYNAIGWDWLPPCSTWHERSHDVPSGTRGTMFSTICDTNPVNCNGRERTNIMFWP